MIFFLVAAVDDPDPEQLRTLISHLKYGEFCAVDLFDGEEHSYIELGGWIGDQGLALQLMGLGSVLGLWQLLTPKSMLGDLIDDYTAKLMAGNGMVSIQAEKTPAAVTV